MNKRRFAAIVLAAMLSCAMCLCLSACGTKGSKDVELTPTVEDSVLITSKTLTVGVDSSMAPFGGESGGQLVGVDVDVAAALASQLGLKLQVVDTSGQNATQLLYDGKVDMIMSAPSSQGANGTTALVGPYMLNGAALFGVADTPAARADTAALAKAKVGAYRGSIAATAASEYCGVQNLVSFTSLSEAFDALQKQEVNYVASDSVAGGYLSLSYPGVTFQGALRDATGCYIGVLSTNTVLANALRDALLTIDENGVLNTVVSKWVGSQTAQYIVPASGAITVQQPQPVFVEEGEGEEGEGEGEEGAEETSEGGTTA